MRLLVGRLGLALLAAGASLVSPAGAQESAPAAQRLGGTVVKGGEPVAGVEVTLHRVTSGQSGPVGTQRTDPSGRFSFPLQASADTAGFNVYFVTAEFQTVRYFGQAVHPGDVPAEYPIQVFDTASSVPEPIRLSRRDIVLVSQPDGGWEVDEIVQVTNPNQVTLVSRGGEPTWEFRIPEGVDAFQAGENELPAEQIMRMEERVLLLMPLVPGELELFFRYRIPASRGEAVLPLESPVDTFNVYVRQPAPSLQVDGLTSTDMVTVAGERFLRYGATALAAGEEVSLQWDSVGPPVSPVLAAVVVTTLLLGIGVLAAVRSTRRLPVGARRANDTTVSRELAASGIE